MESYELRKVYGHYEVYKNGNFIVSADTYKDAINEILDLIRH